MAAPILPASHGPGNGPTIGPTRHEYERPEYCKFGSNKDYSPTPPSGTSALGATMRESSAVNAKSPTERTRLRRLHERGRFDKESLHAILDAGLLCHVGYVVDGAPVVTPTLYWREGDRVYWHGSSASHMLRHQAGGAPVCLTVSHLDGIVLARSGFHHSINYRSVMLFGNARQVTGAAAKERHLKTFMEQLYPGRWDQLRPLTAQEIKATKLLGMDIDEASAKIRTGPPIDDEEDYALPIWAGVVPVRRVIGEPVPDPRLKAGVAEPDHLRHLVLG